MKILCPNRGLIEQTVAQQAGGEITFGLAVTALGTRAVKNPLIAALWVVAGLTVGRYIGREVSKRFPQCGAILRATGLLP